MRNGYRQCLEDKMEEERLISSTMTADDEAEITLRPKMIAKRETTA